MFGFSGIPITDINFTMYITNKLPFLVAGILFSTPIYLKIKEIIDKNRYVSTIVSPICMIILFLITISFLVKGTYNPFIYFNF